MRQFLLHVSHSLRTAPPETGSKQQTDASLALCSGRDDQNMVKNERNRGTGLGTSPSGVAIALKRRRPHSHEGPNGLLGGHTMVKHEVCGHHQGRVSEYVRVCRGVVDQWSPRQPCVPHFRPDIPVEKNRGISKFPKVRMKTSWGAARHGHTPAKIYDEGDVCRPKVQAKRRIHFCAQGKRCRS